MPTTARNIWPTLIDLSKWIDRNCTNCKVRDKHNPLNNKSTHCPVPQTALTSWIQNEPPPATTIGIINNGRKIEHVGNIPPLPNKCKSRKDKRGRPTKQSDILFSPLSCNPSKKPRG